MKDKRHTLFLTRNGLLEPLGQSQVLAYLRGLSNNYRVFLISYEKDEDMAQGDRVERLQVECAKLGIKWMPKRFRSRPRVLAPAFDIVRMFVSALILVRREGICLIHCRSYIPATVGWSIWRLTGTPFLFDMRGLWVEERIMSGSVRRGGLVHKVMLWFERACLRDAAGVVSLTNAAVEHLRNAYPEDVRLRGFAIIPTCTDLRRFRPSDHVRSIGTVDWLNEEQGLRHGCIGTVVSGWFRSDWLSNWCYSIAAIYPHDSFEIITRDNPEAVRRLVDPVGALGEKLSISSRHPSEMPQAIRHHDVSVMFYAAGSVSELGRSPTRLAEVLGSGRPVVVNRGIGDVGSLVEQNHVGVVLSSDRKEEILEAMLQLRQLMMDPTLSARCRTTAETFYSLSVGTAAFEEIYERVISDRRATQ